MDKFFIFMRLACFLIFFGRSAANPLTVVNILPKFAEDAAIWWGSPITSESNCPNCIKNVLIANKSAHNWNHLFLLYDFQICRFTERIKKKQDRYSFEGGSIWQNSIRQLTNWTDNRFTKVLTSFHDFGPDAGHQSTIQNSSGSWAINRNGKFDHPSGACGSRPLFQIKGLKIYAQTRPLLAFINLDVIESGFGVIPSGEDGAPQKIDLKNANEYQRSGKKYKNYIPRTISYLDDEWGRGNLYRTPLIIGCYLLTLILIPLGLMINYRGRRWSGRILFIAGISLDVIGTYILGCPWRG